MRGPALPPTPRHRPAAGHPRAPLASPAGAALLLLCVALAFAVASLGARVWRAAGPAGAAALAAVAGVVVGMAASALAHAAAAQTLSTPPAIPPPPSPPLPPRDTWARQLPPPPPHPPPPLLPATPTPSSSSSTPTATATPSSATTPASALLNTLAAGVWPFVCARLGEAVRLAGDDALASSDVGLPGLRLALSSVSLGSSPPRLLRLTAVAPSPRRLVLEADVEWVAGADAEAVVALVRTAAATPVARPPARHARVAARPPLLSLALHDATVCATFRLVVGPLVGEPPHAGGVRVSLVRPPTLACDLRLPEGWPPGEAQAEDEDEEAGGVAAGGSEEDAEEAAGSGGSGSDGGETAGWLRAALRSLHAALPSAHSIRRLLPRLLRGGRRGGAAWRRGAGLSLHAFVPGLRDRLLTALHAAVADALVEPHALTFVLLPPAHAAVVAALREEAEAAAVAAASGALELAAAEEVAAETAAATAAEAAVASPLPPPPPPPPPPTPSLAAAASRSISDAETATDEEAAEAAAGVELPAPLTPPSPPPPQQQQRPLPSDAGIAPVGLPPAAAPLPPPPPELPVAAPSAPDTGETDAATAALSPIAAQTDIALSTPGYLATLLASHAAEEAAEAARAAAEVAVPGDAGTQRAATPRAAHESRGELPVTAAAAATDAASAAAADSAVVATALRTPVHVRVETGRPTAAVRVHAPTGIDCAPPSEAGAVVSQARPSSSAAVAAAAAASTTAPPRLTLTGLYLQKVAADHHQMSGMALSGSRPSRGELSGRPLGGDSGSDGDDPASGEEGGAGDMRRSVYGGDDRLAVSRMGRSSSSYVEHTRGRASLLPGGGRGLVARAAALHGGLLAALVDGVTVSTAPSTAPPTRDPSPTPTPLTHSATSAPPSAGVFRTISPESEGGTTPMAPSARATPTAVTTSRRHKGDHHACSGGPSTLTSMCEAAPWGTMFEAADDRDVREAMAEDAAESARRGAFPRLVNVARVPALPTPRVAEGLHSRHTPGCDVCALASADDEAAARGHAFHAGRGSRAHHTALALPRASPSQASSSPPTAGGPVQPAGVTAAAAARKRVGSGSGADWGLQLPYQAPGSLTPSPPLPSAASAPASLPSASARLAPHPAQRADSASPPQPRPPAVLPAPPAAVTPLPMRASPWSPLRTRHAAHAPPHSPHVVAFYSRHSRGAPSSSSRLGSPSADGTPFHVRRDPHRLSRRPAGAWEGGRGSRSGSGSHHSSSGIGRSGGRASRGSRGSASGSSARSLSPLHHTQPPSGARGSGAVGAIAAVTDELVSVARQEMAPALRWHAQGGMGGGGGGDGGVGGAPSLSFAHAAGDDGDDDDGHGVVYATVGRETPTFGRPQPVSVTSGRAAVTPLLAATAFVGSFASPCGSLYTPSACASRPVAGGLGGSPEEGDRPRSGGGSPAIVPPPRPDPPAPRLHRTLGSAWDSTDSRAESESSAPLPGVHSRMHWAGSEAEAGSSWHTGSATATPLHRTIGGAPLPATAARPQPRPPIRPTPAPAVVVAAGQADALSPTSRHAADVRAAALQAAGGHAAAAHPLQSSSSSVDAVQSGEPGAGDRGHLLSRFVRHPHPVPSVYSLAALGVAGGGGDGGGAAWDGHNTRRGASFTQPVRGGGGGEGVGGEPRGDTAAAAADGGE